MKGHKKICLQKFKDKKTYILKLETKTKLSKV